MNLASLILVNWILTFGFIPASSLEIDENTVLHYNNSFFQIIGLNFNIADTVNFFTDIEIRDTKARSVYFNPYRADFTIGLEAYYKEYKLGITHECNHDVITSNDFSKNNGQDGAWMNIYFNWSKDFNLTDNISLAPDMYLGFRPYDNLYSKFVTDAIEDYFNDFYHGKYNNTIFAGIGANIDVTKYFGANIAFQPEYSFENRGWDIQGKICIEGKYSIFVLGADWKWQKRFSKAGYAVNELMIYLSLRGDGSFFSTD